MNTRLLTADGFPRADIDVAQSTNVPSRKRSTANKSAQFEQQGLGSYTLRTTTKP